MRCQFSRWARPFFCLLLAGFFLTSGAEARRRPLSVVQHLTRVKIIESNGVSTRPGSVYDIVTRFESIFEMPKPSFNYLFVDTGLGTAEPLYPLKQIGHQGSWFQLLPAFLSERFRHIDHVTSMETPEGCRVDSLYLLRHIHEFDDLYAVEKAEGYDKIVIRLEYYTKTTPQSQCGRHRAFPPDPTFSVRNVFQAITKARRLADIPPYWLERFDARVAAIKHLKEEFSFKKWPRFDRLDTADNSLWYYPQGAPEHYGFDQPAPQPVAESIGLPQDLILPADETMQGNFSLARLLSPGDFQSLTQFWLGQPVEDFHPSTEPGGDTFSLHQVTPANIYTSGIYREEIRDVIADVRNLEHYRLVCIVLRPYESEADMNWAKPEIVPQVRFVFQLRDPRNEKRVFEQLYLHLNFDGVNRLASRSQRKAEHRRFLEKYAAVLLARQHHPERFHPLLQKFLRPYLAMGPEEVAFSSSLTGIWVFGTMSRSENTARLLRPVRIVREGVDVGYYSTLYDNDLFLRASRTAPTYRERKQLEVLLKDLEVTQYRDPRRHDAHTIQFQRMTCAQCHQFSGRDAVHISINDGLDRRVQEPIRPTQFVYEELFRQLQFGQRWWDQ